jgi:hypothetical protein
VQREQAVVDLVDVGEVVGGVVDGVAGLAGGLGELDGAAIGVVEADLVVEDAVEADGLEVGGGFDGADVVAITLATGTDRASNSNGARSVVLGWVIGCSAEGRC